MASPPAAAPARALGGGIPAVIAHGAGNTRQEALKAVGRGADYLEVDLWVHNGRFEARHERAIYPLPVLFEKWYLRFAPRRPFGLRELLTAVPAEAGLFLDLKNGGLRAAELTLAGVQATNGGHRVAASSQVWNVLRHVTRLLPGVDTYYSIDVRSKLDLFLSVAERDVRPKGVSCQQKLLTRPLVERLKERGLLVVAWTVDDLERAEELIEWGVDGITTHRIEEVRGLVGDAGGQE